MAKARLALALIAWGKPNLLLLDEPTNHLDLEMRLALTLALQDFEGAVLVVSHDRHLLKSTTDEFLLVADGRVQDFDSDLGITRAGWWTTVRGSSRLLPLKRSPTRLTSAPSARPPPLRQQLAPHKRQADKLEKDLAGVHESWPPWKRDSATVRSTRRRAGRAAPVAGAAGRAQGS